MSMASPSRQHTFAVRASYRCIVTVAARRVWVLPPDGHEFHSWALAQLGRLRKVVTNIIYMHIYICVSLSVLAGTRGSMLSLGLGHTGPIERK